MDQQNGTRRRMPMYSSFPGEEPRAADERQRPARPRRAAAPGEAQYIPGARPRPPAAYTATVPRPGGPQTPAPAASPAGPTGPAVPPARRALDDLWRAYKAHGDPGLREQLILHYSPLVKYVAGRVGVGLPANVEQADFVSSGVFGLIDAIEKFDPERA